jgi:hypothetical protein
MNWMQNFIDKAFRLAFHFHNFMTPQTPFISAGPSALIAIRPISRVLRDDDNDALILVIGDAIRLSLHNARIQRENPTVRGLCEPFPPQRN